MTNSTKTREALGFAIGRAAAVLWGGLVAAVLYLSVVVVGPTVEGKWFPVVLDYQLAAFTHEADGAVSFRPVFRKVRECTNFGSTWYAPDEAGNFTRLQLLPKDRTAEPPATGPLSARIGQPSMVYPPPGATMLMGVLSHDCGLMWQTRTALGPFSLVDGKPIKAPRPSL